VGTGLTTGGGIEVHPGSTPTPLPAGADAWAGKELLRHLLAKIDGGARPYEIRERLDVFYSHAARAEVPELTRLATTIDTWWPAIEAFLRLRVTNARTEGYNTNINSSSGPPEAFEARPTTSVVSCSPTRQPPRDRPSPNHQIHASPRRAGNSSGSRSTSGGNTDSHKLTGSARVRSIRHSQRSPRIADP